MHCRSVLLKGDDLSAAKAGAQTEMSFVSVNAWVKRYKEEGMDSLKTRSRCERKPIIAPRTRKPSVVPSSRTGNV